MDVLPKGVLDLAVMVTATAKMTVVLVSAAKAITAMEMASALGLAAPKHHAVVPIASMAGARAKDASHFRIPLAHPLRMVLVRGI